MTTFIEVCTFNDVLQGMVDGSAAKPALRQDTGFRAPGTQIGFKIGSHISK